MQGFKPGQRGHYADGGLVEKIKSALGFGKKEGRQPQQPQPSPPPQPQPAPEERAITSYAGMSATDRKMKELGLKNGGPVRGPGTGTSDSIKKTVPEGSYIMPADSTRKLGEENLRTLGAQGFKPKGIPVSLSNGEYEIPPEQVMALGQAVLDAMRGATHASVDGPQEEAQELQREAFADGGSVLGRFFPRTAEPFDEAVRQAKNGEYLRAAGSATRGVMTAAPNASVDALSAAMDPVAKFGKGLFGVEDDAPAASPTSKPANAASPVTPAASADDSGSGADRIGKVGTAGQAYPNANIPKIDDLHAESTTPLKNDIKREGNSYSGMNIGPGFTINGKEPSKGGFVQVNPEGAPGGFVPASMRAADAGGPKTTAIRYGDGDTYGRPRLSDSTSARAMNPNLTASQRNAEVALINSERSNENQARIAEMNAQNQAEISAMNARANAQNAALHEDGNNARFAAGQAMDRQRMAIEQQRSAPDILAKNIQNKEAMQAAALREQYASADEEGKAAIARQIQALSGKSPAPQNNWDAVVLQGGMDAMGNRTEAVMGAVNKQTGEMRRYDGGSPAQKAPPGMKQVGTSEGRPVYEDANGNRFVGA